MALARNGMHGWRAVTAVIALYGFVLQGFLGGLTPGLPTAHDGASCLPDLALVDAAPAGERQAPHRHSEGCMAARRGRCGASWR